jgi:glycerol-3-phosphate cytidylyltransferase
MWLVMDCVDGNIARVKKQSSKMGEFIDAFSGYYLCAFVYLSIGLAAFHSSKILLIDNYIFIILGAIASISDILARLIHSKYLNYTTSSTSLTPNATANKKSFSYIRLRIEKELGISGLFMPFLIVALIFNIFDIMLLFYLAFSMGGLFITSLYYALKSKVKPLIIFDTTICLGRFDKLNADTINILNQIKTHSRKLVVCILSDELLDTNKYMMSIDDRIKILSALKYVDQVICLNTPHLTVPIDAYYVMPDINQNNLPKELRNTLLKKKPYVIDKNVITNLDHLNFNATDNLINGDSINKKYKIGFASGTFDLFHIGHLNIIKRAAALCEYLIIGVKTDEFFVKLRKEPTALSYEDRCAVVMGIKGVNEVVPIHDYNRLLLLGKYKFDAIFVGDDWKGNENWDHTEKILSLVGVEVVWLERTEGVSSSVLRERIKQLNGGTIGND